jgi:hypothetical protein
VFSDLRWELIVCFADIGGIDDPHCLNFLFCVQWVKMRGDCFPDIDGIDDHQGHQFHQYQQNKQSTLILNHWTQKRKFKQWWSSIPSISGKQTIISHLNSLNTRKKVCTVNGHQFHQLFKLYILCSVS